MTEMFKKRFTIGNVLTESSGLRDNGRLMTFNEVVNLLNEQYRQIQTFMEENEQLKQRLERFENYKKASDKFTKEVEEFFERHEIDAVNFVLLDEIFNGFKFYSGKYNELEKENKELKKENEQLKKDREELFIRERDAKNKWRELKQENKQLKERNEHQYKQLQHLWSLMEAKDWETLSEMVNKMEEDEKRLQNEWKCYE